MASLSAFAFSVGLAIGTVGFLLLPTPFGRLVDLDLALGFLVGASSRAFACNERVEFEFDFFDWASAEFRLMMLPLLADCDRPFFGLEPCCLRLSSFLLIFRVASRLSLVWDCVRD